MADRSPPQPSAENSGSNSDRAEQSQVIEELTLPDDDASQAGEPSAPQAPSLPLTPDGYLTPESFHSGFSQALALAGGALGLRTLAEAPQLETAPAASRAIYDTALEVPWLRFLIRPEQKWIGRVLAVGAFAAPVAVGCRMELAARRAPKRAAPSTAPQPANDSQPEPAPIPSEV